jgi:hypothetical protein
MDGTNKSVINARQWPDEYRNTALFLTVVENRRQSAPPLRRLIPQTKSILEGDFHTG